MTKITNDFYPTKSKKAAKGFLSLFVVLLMSTQMSWGQQVIGEFPVTDGGFEGQTLGTLPVAVATVANASLWTLRDNTISGNIINLVGDPSNVRSGSNAASISAVATNKYLQSPALVPLISASTSYTMQYYFRAPAAPVTASQLHISATSSTSGGNQVSGTFVPNSWNKATRTQTTTATVPTVANWTGIRISTYSCAVDDFVVYAGPLDTTVPDPPTVPTLSGLNLSWTAPVAGVDGGGYIVVRYATNPNADNDPNINGIYAVGNTITNGTGSLVGTVVYIGIGTSFTDATNVVGSYYKIYTVDKAFNYSNEIIAGPVLAPFTTWNGTTWSNGTPDSTLEAIIAGTYSGAAFDAKKLTVNSGSMTITSGTMTIHNEVINNAGANGIVFENNANLIQVNSAVNTGNITVNRNSSPLSRLDYTLWSSPVVNQNLAAFSPATSSNRFYNYTLATNQYSAIIDPGTTPFATGSGYLIRMPNTASDFPSTQTFNGQFIGVPNNGDLPVAIVDGGATFRYNLVGNPYPSPISIWSFVNDNATNIESTLYFWRKTNGPIGQTSSYCTFAPGVLIGDTGTFVTNSNTQSADPLGVIQTGQGFFVEAKASATTLTFKNSQRVVNTAGQFFKTKQTVQASKIWLNATSASGDFSQMAVTYFADATVGLDRYDGKYINDSAFALTSNINNEEFIIQGRPAFDVSDVVALNFKTDKAGDYKIAIDHLEGVFAAGQDIYLVDSKTGDETNLKTGSYNFTAASGIDNARFSLKYQKTLKVDASILNENSVTVYKNNGTLYVNSREIAIESIQVYDVQGRLIAERKNVKANTATLDNLKANNQVLLVKISGVNNEEVTKKVVN